MSKLVEAIEFFKRMGGVSGAMADGTGDLMRAVFDLGEGQVVQSGPEIIPRNCSICQGEMLVSEETAALCGPEHPMNMCGKCLDHIAEITADESKPLPDWLLAHGDKALAAIQNPDSNIG